VSTTAWALSRSARGRTGGILNPFAHASRLVIRQFRKQLFGEATLQDLPAPGEGPRFTIYATSLQTGRSVRLARGYLADYRIGTYPDPQIQLAEAVAASAAFPPPLCPVTLSLDPDRWVEASGAELFGEEYVKKHMYLADGGVYDNLGLERIWNRCSMVLVSDGGAPFQSDRRVLGSRWSLIARTKRTLDIMGDQVHALRTSRLMRDFQAGERTGAYWGVATHIKDYDLQPAGKRAPMTQDSGLTAGLCRIRTRLNRFSAAEQGHLINWGYALTDAAMRRYVLASDPEPGAWPDSAHAL
jgi:NTE family protein